MKTPNRPPRPRLELRTFFRAAIAAIAVLGAVPTASADGAEWLSSLEGGRARAREDGRPLLVLVTAPGWCEPCDRFEATLADTGVQDLIGAEFVAVRLTDRDPAHAVLEFPGYPSILVFDSDGRRLGAIRGPGPPRELRTALADLADTAAANSGGAAGNPGAAETRGAAANPGTTADPPAAPEPPERAGAMDRPAYRYPGGAFIRLSDERWVREAGDEPTSFRQYRADDRYAYLQSVGNAGAEQFFAIPMDGGQAFRWDGDDESWVSAFLVSAPD